MHAGGEIGELVLAGRATAQHHEFVAAQPRYGVLGAHHAADAFSELREQAVADRMAIGIVDGLEAVEVQEQQSETRTDPLRLFHGLAEAVFQQQAVGQAGERIVQGQVGQFLVGLMQGIGRNVLRLT